MAYLLFTAACMSLVFVFFQIYLRQFLGLVIYDFVENFKCYLLIIKRVLITRIIQENLKNTKRVIFMGHPLDVSWKKVWYN